MAETGTSSTAVINRVTPRQRTPQKQRWVPSRFNARTTRDDGSLILYNSYTGVINILPPHLVPRVTELLRRQGFELAGEPDGLTSKLVRGGFLVRAEVDEFRRARMMHEREIHGTETQHLILMPHEDCNFRCVYCYETFKIKKMRRDVRQGIKNYVRKRARGIRVLGVSWFGGEPLLAPDVIADLSAEMLRICAEHDIAYEASITTNGYLLTPDVAELLLKAKVTTIQITLDGPKQYHDQRRVLKGGGGTYDLIIENLRQLRARPDPFKVLLRVNFDRENVGGMDQHIDALAAEFADDPRFTVYFRPIGTWGGPNDTNLPVCVGTEGDRQMITLTSIANQRRLRSSRELLEALQPNASVCYAARENSIIVRADGKLSKCTVALDDERNFVGRITPDGDLELDQDRFAVWVTSDEGDDPGCQRCFYRPSCQGSACPLIRMNTGEAPCPTTKIDIKRVLQVIGSNA